MKITFDKVSKNFALQAVVSDVSLTIDSGEFVAVTGPSGCGKSTLLNLIAGLETASQGRVLVGPTDMGQVRPGARDRFRLETMGFVFQFFHLLPTLNVLENACLPAFEKFPKQTRSLGEEARRLLEQLGLGADLHKYPRQLSGGMQSRAGFARAILMRPKVMLADEPTGSLDSASGEALMAALVDFHRSHNSTLVLVTHDQKAATMANRRLHMLDGRINSQRESQPVDGGK
jgi:putative ABC transport system ATP-binding protein